MIELPPHFHFEQAVYGSFSFWNRGYGILARSAGCRPEWLAELRTVCQRFGEPPALTPLARSVFALRLASGPWLIAVVIPQGCDDQGRPGALAFHTLFAGSWAYRWLGAEPFALSTVLGRSWTPADQDQVLPAIRWPALTIESTEPPPPVAHDNAVVESIAHALIDGRRVVIESHLPIESLVRSVWTSLPGVVRRRTAVATWAFDNANGFDLIAMPRLSAAAIDRSALVIALDNPRPPLAEAPAGQRSAILSS
jgi:hypothetical protein